MSQPVNPGNNKDWYDPLVDAGVNSTLTGLHSGTKLAWGVTSSLAAPLQKFGNWAWQAVGGHGSRAENYWKDCSESTRNAAKKVGYATAWTGSAVAGAAVGSAFLGAVPGIMIASTLGTSTAAGLGTAVYSWVKQKNPLMTALAHGGAAATATGVAVAGAAATSILSPAMAAGALVGLPAGNLALGATIMAANPNHSVLVQVPERGLLELTTPNTSVVESNPLVVNPELTLQALTGKVCEFRENHPESLLWTDPHTAILENLSRLGPNGELSILVKAQRAIEALGLNPAPQLKLDAVSQVLSAANFNIAPTLLNIHLIEKMEAIPFDSKEYVTAKKETDKQLALLVKKSSIFSTIFFIHINRLGNENTDEVNESIKEIIKEATAENAGNLWDIYVKHLGHGLCGWDRLVAKFYFWLSHDLGITWNTLNEFLTNVISVFRGTVEPKNQEKLNTVFNKAFDQLSLYLDLSNGAARKFANADDPLGNLPVYQQLVIDRLGNDQLYQKVLANLKPGEDLGQKMMEELCTSFTHVLIDECFPTISIFRRAKTIPLIGFLFVRPIAWLIELIINKIARSETKKRLPYGIQSLVDIGLGQTLPNQYSFKIAIANSLTRLIEGFHNDMENPTTSKPHSLDKSAVIDGAAARILETLKLRRIGKNPTKEMTAKFFQELANPSDPKVDKILEALIAQGAKEFMYYYSKKPEKMEGLIGDMFAISNDAFDPSAVIASEDDYKAAFKRLRNATKAMAKDAIKDEIKKEVKGPVTQEVLDEYLKGAKDSTGRIIEPGIYEVQKTRGIQDFEILQSIGASMSAKLAAGALDEEMSLLKDLDQYAETLKKFANDAEGMNLAIYPKPVQHAFYRAFHGIYKDIVPLAQLAIDLQKPQLNYSKLLNVVEKFAEIENMIVGGYEQPAAIRKKLDQLAKLSTSHDHVVQGFNDDGVNERFEEHLLKLRQHVDGMEVAAAEAEKARVVISKLQTLGSPANFARNLIADPKKWNTITRDAIPRVDQDQLFAPIRELQRELKKAPIDEPAVVAIGARIATELEAILVKYNGEKTAQLDLKEASMTSFRNKVQKAMQEYSQIREAEKTVIKKTLDKLNLDTVDVLDRIKNASMPTVTIPLSDLPQNAVDDLYGLIGVPMEKKIDPYLDAAFDLITDSHSYHAAARLVMGNAIKAHQTT